MVLQHARAEALPSQILSTNVQPDSSKRCINPQAEQLAATQDSLRYAREYTDLVDLEHKRERSFRSDIRAESRHNAAIALSLDLARRKQL